VEITTSHFDDGAETTVIGAAARSLDDICLAAKDRLALQHPRTAVWKANLVIFQPVQLRMSSNLSVSGQDIVHTDH